MRIRTPRASAATVRSSSSSKRKAPCASEQIIQPSSPKRVKLSPQVVIKNEQRQPDLPSPIETIFWSLPYHTPTFKSLLKTLEPRKWYLIDQVPTFIKDLGHNYPRLIPASRCWTKRESPPIQKIMAHSIDNFSPGDVTIEAPQSSHPSTHTVGNVIAQVLQPPPQDPMVAHNISLEGYGIDSMDPTAFPTDPFELPPGEIDFSMNITPANTIVDIHIDQGTNGLSIGLGREADPTFLKVHKVWFLWPPTAHNIAEYERLRQPTPKGQAATLRLARSEYLEHGVITSIGCEAGIFLPAGWLHATITTQGGFLGGITFNSRATIGMASKLMAIDCRLFQGNVEALAPLYWGALCTVTDCSKVMTVQNINDAVNGWLEIEKSLRSIKFKVGRHKAICKKLLEEWKKVTREKGAIKLIDRKNCECGWKGKNFGAHFWSQHLKVITPDKYRTPSD